MLSRKLIILDKRELIFAAVLNIILIAILGLLILPNIVYCNQLEVLNDEFGYWSIAAQWAGKNWKELIPSTPYYSYGYSIVLLPLFCIFSNPISMYRSAIILNFFLLVTCFFLLKKIGRAFFPDINTYEMSFIVFAICLYPNTCFQIQIAWPETILFFLFTLIIVILMKYEEKPSVGKSILVIMLSILMYMVHKRTIFIILIILMTFILMHIKEKRKTWFLIVLFFLCFLGYKLANLISEYNIQIFWNSSEQSQINATSISLIGVYSKAIISNFKGFIYSFIGKNCYFFLIAGPVFFSGICFCIRKIYEDIKQRKKHIKYCGTCFFIIGSYVTLIGISTLAFVHPERQDQIVYGRYADCILSVILLIGIGNLLCNIKRIKIILISSTILCVLVCITSISVKLLDVKNFAVCCSTGLAGIYHELIGSNEMYIWTIALIQLLLSFISVVVLLYYKKITNLVSITIIVLFSIFWISMYSITNYYQIQARQIHNQNVFDIAIPILEKYEDYKIVYCMDPLADPYAKEAKKIQFIIQDRPIHVENLVDITVKENKRILLIENSSLVPQEICENGILIGTTQSINIYLY